jgi:hypothetical protein
MLYPAQRLRGGIRRWFRRTSFKKSECLMRELGAGAGSTSEPFMRPLPVFTGAAVVHGANATLRNSASAEAKNAGILKGSGGPE